jgi:hypothetical protein
METEKTNLQKAVDLLEGAGFHVDRAYEENNRDAGNSDGAGFGHHELLTGAICLRITPYPVTA